VIDKSFWDRLRVKKLLDDYLEGFIEYAELLQDEYSLTNKHIIGVLNMAISAKLSKLSATWKKVTPIVSSFSNIADGDYIGDLKEMKIGESKAGRTQVVVEWEVADGELAGKKQKQFYGLTDNVGNADEVGMGHFKNVTEILGLDLSEDLNLWQEEMDAFVASNTALFEITVKAKGDYSNVYVNGVSEYSKGGEEAAVEETTTEEEVVDVTEEEVVEEAAEEVQEVVVPAKKVVAKVTARPIAKPAVAAKPVAKTAVPVKKIVSLKR
jgi:hypothetical protein